MTQSIPEELLKLIDRYWNLAYAEGKEDRTHDTEAGDAQKTRAAIEDAIESLSRQLEEAREALKPFVKAEREIATTLFFGNSAYSIVWPDDMPIGLLWNEEKPDEALVSVTWGDFRRAKETTNK